jgi:Ca2+-binding EF-hand superfamily protein
MRKILLAAAGVAVLGAGGVGVALAQEGDSERDGRHGVFQSDSNADGVLTRAEFDAGRDAMFARLDQDHNGNLTREEMRAGRSERGHRGWRRHRGGGMHVLTRADANNDGDITRDEFLARPLEHFDRLDANDDGVISTAERPQRGERGGRGEGERRADRPNPDANGDGSFSRAEFAAMGAHVFERLDGDDDGRVTREEAQAARGHHRRGRD